MIPNGEKWHYLSVKRTICIIMFITSKHYGDFYCLNCLHRTKNKLELHKRVCKIKIFLAL